MEIKLLIDVTPKLEKLLSNLGGLLSVQAPAQTQQAQPAQPVQPVQTQPKQAPAQTVQQTQPQQVPTQQTPTQPVQTQPQQAPAQSQQVPTQAPTYTMDQLAVAATQLMDSGRQQELLDLLASFGIQALTQLPKDQYGAFATKLRELGAKI
ncbi:hypothetical protein [Heyndrickxia faecalis]|uniref:hypothetical protein n=1 Tax=Heyndrickxia faecalis TaxID=2824910 RepID=UPI003D1E2BC5